jgi:hypothetical protein
MKSLNAYLFVHFLIKTERETRGVGDGLYTTNW